MREGDSTCLWRRLLPWTYEYIQRHNLLFLVEGGWVAFPRIGELPWISVVHTTPCIFVFSQQDKWKQGDDWFSAHYLVTQLTTVFRENWWGISLSLLEAVNQPWMLSSSSTSSIQFKGCAISKLCCTLEVVWKQPWLYLNVWVHLWLNQSRSRQTECVTLEGLRSKHRGSQQSLKSFDSWPTKREWGFFSKEKVLATRVAKEKGYIDVFEVF